MILIHVYETFQSICRQCDGRQRRIVIMIKLQFHDTLQLIDYGSFRHQFNPRKKP